MKNNNKNFKDNRGQANTQILKEINSAKIDIDRTMFQKTEEEKAILWKAKQDWKNRTV